MAAKPPKPPGNFLKQIDNKNTASNNSAPFEANNNHCPTNSNSNSNSNSNNTNTKLTTGENNVLEKVNANNPKPSCNCTNISIMHLFHEMKQEFPTIPDPIVAQCVNENCHQRENCVQVLRNELALNPIPVQSYPAKVLHQQQQQQRQKLQSQQSVQKPPTALKPIRLAPVQPIVGTATPTTTPLHNSNTNLSSNLKSISHSPHLKPSHTNNSPTRQPPLSPNNNNNNCNKNSPRNPLCDSVELANNNLKAKDVIKSNSVPDNSSVRVESTTTPTTNTSDMPTPTRPVVNSAGETPTNQNCQNETNNATDFTNSSPTSTPPQQPPRTRPTTLNLQTQQQQRQQLNVQLQQHFQRQQQQQQKPLRKAPLPPLPPKPTQFNTPTPTTNSQFHHSTSSHSQQSSFSNDSSLPSPISSGESEISVNVSLSSPVTQTHHHPNNNNNNNNSSNNHQQLKSPIRHRSVITVQPEPPYTRDFLVSPTSSSGGSQKSFTSVNLTLRQPNSAIPQSTIDISAGPGQSGASSGLTYSSTSYDARRGYQKNFHITVTDAGGVFSASRIRPRSCLYAGEHEEDSGGGDSSDNSGVNPLRSVASEHNVLQQQHRQQQQQLQQYPSPQHSQHYIVAANNTDYGDMCLPRESDGFGEILRRQRSRRDKLATALRDNKKRLSQVRLETSILVDPVSPGQSERLDSEIQRLRCECEAMLNEIEIARRCGTSLANSHANNNSLNIRQNLQQPQPQPFPRQRPPRPPPPAANQRQPQLDFIQHHSSTANTPTTLNSPNLPPYYQQQFPADEEDCSDSNTEGGEDEEEPQEMWACNMCTFRNHPQLNMCECCENVRISPESPVLSREDIHITLSPGENRIIHSWIVS